MIVLLSNKWVAVTKAAWCLLCGQISRGSIR